MPDAAALTLGLADPWPSLIQRFLVEQQRRFGSDRTVESYGRLLRSFATSVAKPPAQMGSADVFKSVDHIGATGRSPFTTTVGAPLTCLSSFFQFLVGLGQAPANPCGAVARPKARPPAPSGLTADDVRRVLAVVPKTPLGLRDRAVILMLRMTGRRRAEVLRLSAGDVEPEGSQVYYRYRGKGGRQGAAATCRAGHRAAADGAGDLDGRATSRRPVMAGRGTANGLRAVRWNLCR